MKSKKEQVKSDLHCGFCSKEFKYESERKRHEQSHSPQFQCKVCSKNSAVRRHEKQHERTGVVECCECHRKFRDEALLKRHIKYAHKGSFTCTKCEATFSSELALRSHAKSHKPVSERRYHCSYHGCTKSFNFGHHLKHHELTHTNLKQHYCNVCGKGFIQSHHLKSHKKIHESKNELACDISGCEETFTTESARKKHIATHDITIKHQQTSSDIISSSCDITGLIEPDTVKCTSCKQIVLREHYAEHLANCVVSSNIGYDVNSSKVEKEALTKLEPVKIDFHDDIRDCKSFVGGCIIGAETNANENCLCAQISTALDSKDYYELAANENTDKVLGDSELVKPNNSDKVDICEGCDCASLKSQAYDSNRKTSEYKIIRDELPQIEYRRDGTIKIKETFDLHMEIIKKENIDLVPYNSCKDVLGNCIVSGNGIIGEGCLCARMAIDDQQMSSQEIEELTPRPKSNIMP